MRASSSALASGSRPPPKPAHPEAPVTANATGAKSPPDPPEVPADAALVASGEFWLPPPLPTHEAGQRPSGVPRAGGPGGPRPKDTEPQRPTPAAVSPQVRAPLEDEKGEDTVDAAPDE